MLYELDNHDLALVARITNVLPEDRAEAAIIEREWLVQAQRRLAEAQQSLRSAEREVLLRQACIARFEES